MTSKQKAEISPIQFVDWDHRPAVLVGDEAFAVLIPGGPWVALGDVSRNDVYHTAAVLPECYWRCLFLREGFGNLDTWRWRPGQDNIPQSRPLPTAKDFDDAVRAVRAANLAHVANLAYQIANAPLVLEIDGPPITPIL